MIVALHHQRRRGAAAVMSIVVLTVVSILSLTAISRFATARRTMDDYAHRTQADWLAQSGLELATARLLADPNGYIGETVKPLPHSEVRIVVRKDSAEKDMYRIECDARYPSDSRGTVVRSVSRILKR